MFRNLELIYSEEINTSPIHIEKTSFVNSRTLVKESNEINKNAKVYVELYNDLGDKQIVRITDKNKNTTTTYYVINKNNRLFLKKTEYLKQKWSFSETSLIITGDEINKQDIEYRINRIFKTSYHHEHLYLPNKQNLDDFEPIDEKEILGEVTNSFEDNNDEYDFYLDFFEYDMRDYDVIEDNILDWLKI